MSKSDRKARLLPNGEPRYVRCYDNGGTDAKGGTIDRYTVVFSGKYRRRLPNGQFDCDHQVLGMSGYPFHPQGFCQHMEYPQQIDAPQGWPPAIGRKCHLGTRIPFSSLPEDCKKAVMQDYLAIWGLAEEAA